MACFFTLVIFDALFRHARLPLERDRTQQVITTINSSAKATIVRVLVFFVKIDNQESRKRFKNITFLTQEWTYISLLTRIWSPFEEKHLLYKANLLVRTCMSTHSVQAKLSFTERDGIYVHAALCLKRVSLVQKIISLSNGPISNYPHFYCLLRWSASSEAVTIHLRSRWDKIARQEFNFREFFGISNEMN